MRTNNPKKKFSLLILAFLLCTKIILADEFTLIEQTFESSNFKNLDVKTFTGNVTLKTWDNQAVNVSIKGNQEALKSVDYKLENKDGNITVTTNLKNESNKPIELWIEVYTPKYFNADIKTLGGDIKIGTLAGNIKLETTGGDINISEIIGESDLKSVGGSIKVSAFKGNIYTNTSGGNINLEGFDGEVKAETAGGDIKVKYSGNNNLGMTLKTVGGDIKVILPETFKAMLDATTTAGEIKTDFSVLVNKDYSGQKLNGIINGGGNIIKCTTTGGKISILK
jgi:DUF4097 and DUF4098 domain-containing protein YvlB